MCSARVLMHCQHCPSLLSPLLPTHACALTHVRMDACRHYNRYLAILANIPMGIPAAIQFKRYHLEHHKYQGEDRVDVDIPTDIEGKLFKSRPGKFLWMFLQPAFYALRPLFTNPKAPGKWEFINAGVIIACDYAVYSYAGFNGVFYLVAGTLLGMGVHPVAGHFVASDDSPPTTSFFVTSGTLMGCADPR